MPSSYFAQRHPDPRILVLSQRTWNRAFYQCFTYELEDFIASHDATDLLAPRHLWQGWFRSRSHFVMSEALNRVGLTSDGGIEPMKLDRDYDLFFAVLSFPTEISQLKRIKDLRKRCKRAVCFFVELWSADVEKRRANLEILNELEFDHVFLSHRSCIPAMSEVVKRPMSLFPFGVDCMKFVPHQAQPARSIDCLSIGRRSEVTHASLLNLSSPDFFYVYDTLKAPVLTQWKEHRQLVASMIQRSRYFISYKPAFRKDVEIRKDESLAPRLFEGTAGGAVLLGIAPNCPEYAENFNWPDANIEIPYECTDIREIISDLDAQPDRMERARMQNMTQALRRHDWTYRWKYILSTVGLEPSPEMLKREAYLAETADRFTQKGYNEVKTETAAA